MAANGVQPSRGRFIGNVLVTALFFPAVILLLGGNWRWVAGWLFALWFDAMLLFNMVYLYRADPALLAERAKRPGSDNQQRWDTYLLSAIYVLACLWLVILPLDAERFGWSPPFPQWLRILGGVLLFPAIYLIERATIDNTYLSTLVRVQRDREQRVITTGSYRIVRHPLYLGCLLMMVGAPLMVGSLWGLLLTAIGLIGIVYRITGEEALLIRELDGYDEYKRNVRYRLLPFVW